MIFRHLLILLVSFCFFSACTCVFAEEPISEDNDFSDFEDEFAEVESKESFDPLIKYNRFMFAVNEKFYYWLFKPVAKGYSFSIPSGGRIAIDHFFENLEFPRHFVNNLLQLKLKNAGKDCMIFGINLTAGILGFRNYASSKFDMNTSNEDFGQTLGHYGVGDGFVIVFPLLGIRNLRDGIGAIPDYFLDPVSYVNPTYARIVITSYEKVNYLSLHQEEYEILTNDAIDRYTFIRDLYNRIRDKRVKE